MHDPRLIEIDFLMDVDLKLTLSVCVHNGDQTLRYGIDSSRFRDMVIALLSQGYLAGMELRAYGSSNINEGSLAKGRNALISDLCDRKEIKVVITHLGRVRLWNMRDALLQDPDIEPFGLRSRAAWGRELFVWLRWASSDSPLSAMFMDLDDFGKINKKHGATVGDKVLRVVFGLIRNTVGSRGSVYRYGGEEIGVLLPGMPLSQAAAMAENLRSLIEHETCTQVSELVGPQTASIGVESFDHPIENDTVVARIDKLMRAAKNAGKNRVEVVSVLRHRS
jgi:diguanylate cyclase (GGDEF)-like protein